MIFELRSLKKGEMKGGRGKRERERKKIFLKLDFGMAVTPYIFAKSKEMSC